MDDNEFLESYLSILEEIEGKEGGDTTTDIPTGYLGIVNTLGIDPADYPNNPRGLAKAVAEKNIQELKRIGVNWDELPLSMKYNALDMQFNFGSLNVKAQNYLANLKAGNYAGAINETLDALSANDPKDGKQRPVKGIALRRAKFYNLVASDIGVPTITSVDAVNQDNPQKSAKFTYGLDDGNTIVKPFTVMSLHSRSVPGLEKVLGFEEEVDVKPTGEPLPETKLDERGIAEQTKSAFPATGDEQYLDQEGPIRDTGTLVEPEESRGILDRIKDFITPDTDEEKRLKEIRAEEPETLDLPEELSEARDFSVLRKMYKDKKFNEGGLSLSEQMDTIQDPAVKQAKRRAKERTTDKTELDKLKDVAKFGAEFIPGVGEAMAVKRVSDAMDEKDYVGAGIETAAGALGLIPVVGDMAGKALRTSFKKTRKAYKLFVKGEDEKLYPLFVDANKPVKQGEFLEANFPDVAFKSKRKEGSKESFYVPTKGAKRSKGEKTKGTGDSILIPDETTRQKLIDEGFITEKTRRTKEAPFGRVTAVAARPGWHASQAPVATHLGPQDLKVSKKEAEKLVEAGVTPEAIKRRGNQFYVKRRAEDQVFAEVDMADDVDYQSMLAKEGKSDINDRVPKGGSYKYSDGQADSDQWVVGGNMKVNKVLSREETRKLQKEMGVVDLPYRDEVEAILRRKFSEGGIVMDDYIVGKVMDEKPSQKFAEGGMSKQMKMFEDGGLMDEGNTIDPISGNDVPPGSTQEEVRDDIPAQLSEGEFVFPADVVRYIGLEKLMQMRQQAKMGLQTMEDMGQMGNSEEAIMPDNLPFELTDLDMDDEEEYNNDTVELQQGGLLGPATGISGYVPSQVPATSFVQQPQAPVTPTVQQPTQATTPIAPTYTPPTQQAVPTFTPEQMKDVSYPGVLQTPEAAPKLIDIINPTTGEKRTITYIPGVTQLPEGFVLASEYDAPDAQQVSVTPTVGQTSVREDTTSDRRKEEAARAKMELDKARLEMTKELFPFTKPADPFSVSTALGKLEPGTRTATGYIIGDNGEYLDPLTGEQKFFGLDSAKYAINPEDKPPFKVTSGGINEKFEKYFKDKAEKRGEFTANEKQQLKAAKTQKEKVDVAKKISGGKATFADIKPAKDKKDNDRVKKEITKRVTKAREEAVKNLSKKQKEEEEADTLAFKTGGLASKPKPKPKQMRSGGLASKN